MYEDYEEQREIMETIESLISKLNYLFCIGAEARRRGMRPLSERLSEKSEVLGFIYSLVLGIGTDPLTYISGEGVAASLAGKTGKVAESGKVLKITEEIAEKGAVDIAQKGLKETAEATGKELSKVGKEIDTALKQGDELDNIIEGGSETITYRRVQGGQGTNSSQPRVVIDNDGNVYINKTDKNLNISIDNGEHSQHFLNNRPNADIYEFEVPRWFDDMVQENTIPQAGYKNNPLNQGGTAPKLTDPTTPGKSIEFPAPWVEWMEEN